MTLVRRVEGKSLTLQEIQDCKDGPLGQRAIGVTIAKTFDGVEFKETVDSFRQARTRFYYHVTYTDGDEEELSQTELRDGYLLGLSDEIERQWQKYKDSTKEDKIVDQANDNSEDECSDGEGSQYDNTDFNEEVREKRKQRVDKREKTTKKKKCELSGLVLPQSGTKMYRPRLSQN